MAQDFFPARTSEPDLRYVDVRLHGAGTSAPTKVYGLGVTVARSGVGVYTLTFKRAPGSWVGFTFGLDSTTPANVKNHDVVCAATSTTVITVNFFDAAGAAHDLVAGEWLNLQLRFRA